MKIGILYICTGNYTIFWKEFYESMERFFISDAEKHYFVFTDSHTVEYEKENLRIHRIYQENLGWPNNTLMRFHIFLKEESRFTSMDYLFFCNANLLVQSPISASDFLPTKEESLLAVIHPGFFNKKRNKFTYDNNPLSTAYIAQNEGTSYFAGGLNGGVTKDFIDAMKTMGTNIDIDTANNTVALWHDESHWNKFLIDKPYVKKLPPSYLYPEGWNIPFDPIILVRDKTKYGGHDQLRNIKDGVLIHDLDILQRITIDIVIPVYNGEAFVIDALKSVSEQVLLPDTIYVVNDGSTDNTIKLVEEYANKSLLPITIITKENGGLSSARNAGINASRSAYIAFLDADDVWLPNKLSEQIKVFSETSFSTVGLVYCNYDLINNDGSQNKKDYIVPLDKNIKGSVFKQLLKSNKILSSGSGVLIKKEVFDTVGLFDETLKFGEDWDMWLRIAEKYEVDYSNKVLVHIRRHQENMTHDPKKVFLGELAFINHWAKRLGNPDHIPRHWIDKISFTILKQNPKSHYIELTKEHLSPVLYNYFYKNYFNSIILYTIVFVLRTIISAVLSSEARGKILSRI